MKEKGERAFGIGNRNHWNQGAYHHHARRLWGKTTHRAGHRIRVMDAEAKKRHPSKLKEKLEGKRRVVLSQRAHSKRRR